MWLLVGLGVISVAIMLERLWFYFTLRLTWPSSLPRSETFCVTETLTARRSVLEQSP
jgi:hypothetical protein